MSAAFETLPPDQRAVLQLILKQGRGYADLSGLLKIDEAAVRARAHAGLDALAPAGAGDALSDERRAQIADYLLGQQDGAARAATLQHLEDSRAARRWAGALHEQLAPVASAGLPDVPAASNGARADAAPAAAPAADAAPAQAAPAARAAAPAADAPPAASAPRAAAPAPASTRRPQERRASKLGGALLLGGVAVLVAVVLILVLGNGGDDDPGDDAPPAQTQAQRTTPARAEESAPTVLQQVNLNPPGGGRAVGVAFLMIQDQRPVVAIQVQDIAANGADDVYAAWLRASSDGRARFLGYVPNQVGRDGRFTVSSALPSNTASYDQVVVAREAVGVTEAPRTPGEIVLQGTIRVNRDAQTGTG